MPFDALFNSKLFMNRILLQREKVQVSRSFEDLGRRTGIPKGLKQKWKIPEERGVSDFGIRRARGG